MAVSEAVNPGSPASSARREEILALAAAMFADRGFATTTVREIAEQAGILSGSLYHHFDSKESMVEELLRSFLDEIGSSYREIVARADDPAETLRALVHAAFGALRSHGAAVAVMLNEYNVLVEYPRFGFLREAAEQTEQLWVSVLDRGMRSGVFRATVDAPTVYRFMRDAIWISVRWYRIDGELDPDALADRYLDVLLGGIAREKADHS